MLEKKQKNAEESIEEALEEEVELSKAKGYGTYTTERDGTLPSLTMSTDTAWNQIFSGRKYNSASGVTNIVGGYSGKVCDSHVAYNRCRKCAKGKKYKKLEKRAVSAGNIKKASRYKSKYTSLKSHRCFKNYDGSWKGMEADSIVKMVLHFPSKKRAYIRRLCMDDDATTLAHLQEDEEPESKRRLPKELTGISIVANPSHRKRAVGNVYYKLAKKKSNSKQIIKEPGRATAQEFRTLAITNKKAYLFGDARQKQRTLPSCNWQPREM